MNGLQRAVVGATIPDLRYHTINNSDALMLRTTERLGARQLGTVTGGDGRGAGGEGVIDEGTTTIIKHHILSQTPPYRPSR